MILLALLYKGKSCQCFADGRAALSKEHCLFCQNLALERFGLEELASLPRHIGQSHHSPQHDWVIFS